MNELDALRIEADSRADIDHAVAVIDAARLYVSMRKATIETEADSGLLPQSLYELEADQLAALDRAIIALESTAGQP